MSEQPEKPEWAKQLEAEGWVKLADKEGYAPGKPGDRLWWDAENRQMMCRRPTMWERVLDATVHKLLAPTPIHTMINLIKLVIVAWLVIVVAKRVIT
jgi:hypothetical protein